MTKASVCCPSGQIRPSHVAKRRSLASDLRPLVTRLWSDIDTHTDVHQSANLSDSDTLSQSRRSSLIQVHFLVQTLPSHSRPCYPRPLSRSITIDRSDPLVLHRMPLDNIQKCAVLLMLLDQLRDQLEDEWNNVLYTPVSRHSGSFDKEECIRKRRDALADTEKRLHKCADNAKLIVVMAAQNELP